MRRLIINISLIISLLSAQPLIAQTTNVSGHVGVNGHDAIAATVSLLNAKDSSWIMSDITDDKGGFFLKDVPYGSYIIAATSVGYTTNMQTVELKDNGDHTYILTLIKENNTLDEVAVTAKKSFIEMSLGKTVVNVEGTTTAAGTTVLDMLRRLPGVTVDQNGNISMHGKQGVLVLIDDRPVYLSGDDLAQYLKAITASETGQIELITQPGAKYDAAGNTGIINIKLKKNKREGWNGNVMASYGQGIYFHRNESALLNYKVGKLNLSLSGSDMEAIGFADWTEHLYFLNPATGNTTGSSYVHSTPKERFSNTVLRFTADYDVNDKVRIGSSTRATYHPNTNNGYIWSGNSDVSGTVNSYNGVTDADGFIRKDVMTNAYITYKVNKESALDINFDYLLSNRNARQDINNTGYDYLMNAFPYPAIMNSRQLSSVNVYSIKADYTRSFKNGVKIETGIKSSAVTTDNNALFRLYESGMWLNDTGRTNRFIYKEQINAVYGTLSRKFGARWDMRAALRAEQTNTRGIQSIHNEQFDRHYLSLFPTAYLNYAMDSNDQFELNYGRRIERPAYSQLNPFIYYSFQYNYSKGNPDLLPVYSNNIELKHSYKNILISTVAFSHATNMIGDISTADDSTKVIYNTSANFAGHSDVYYSLLFNKDLFKWWTLNAGGSVFYAVDNAVINNRTRHVEWTGYSLSVNSRFNLGKDWQLEAYAGYNSAGRWSVNATFDANLYMELGLSKKISKHFQLNLFAADPFYLNRVGAHVFADNFRADSKFRYASQLYSVSVTYSFGKSKSAEQRNKSIDEAGRIK
ncbi:MAG: hypothetical protein JWQ38_1205 [Flavipsychrobacter sp.]|nr:hypothetical protein [Flavipsychrobacter sp.]